MSLAYGWKLALVAISLLPMLVICGFLEMRLMDHLQDDLREAYGKSAQIACEQIAAIRTVASLRRENALHQEFVTSLDAPVRKAMLSTTKSTFVLSFNIIADFSIFHSVRVLLCLSMYVTVLCC
jgi:ATP-binding cassette subfamily B (MDR/TAP) protein 1